MQKTKIIITKKQPLNVHNKVVDPIYTPKVRERIIKTRKLIEKTNFVDHYLPTEKSKAQFARLLIHTNINSMHLPKIESLVLDRFAIKDRSTALSYMFDIIQHPSIKEKYNSNEIFKVMDILDRNIGFDPTISHEENLKNNLNELKELSMKFKTGKFNRAFK